MIRPSYATGFYPSNKKDLFKLLGELFSKVEGGRDYRCGVVPHAGYVYSGLCAASFFKSLKKTNQIVILGNDHYGNTNDISLHSYSKWETPLGMVEVETELSEQLDFLGLPVVESPNEHSIEVQLPFLQYILKKFSFLPITIPRVSYNRLKEVGEALRSLDVPIIATSDFSHYVPRDLAAARDSLIIGEILKMNPKNLIRKVNEIKSSMCGLNPIITLLNAMKHKDAELISYYTSGDITGDTSSVVGYASIGFR